MNGSAVAASDCRHIVLAPGLGELIEADEALKDSSCTGVPLMFMVMTSSGEVKPVTIICTQVDLPPDLIMADDKEIMTTGVLAEERVCCFFQTGGTGDIGS